MTIKHFEKDTPIRCNRCNTMGKAPRDFTATKENSRAWRMQDMVVNQTCGHMDAHWVYNIDIA